MIQQLQPSDKQVQGALSSYGLHQCVMPTAKYKGSVLSFEVIIIIFFFVTKRKDLIVHTQGIHKSTK